VRLPRLRIHGVVHALGCPARQPPQASVAGFWGYAPQGSESVVAERFELIQVSEMSHGQFVTAVVIRHLRSESHSSLTHRLCLSDKGKWCFDSTVRGQPGQYCQRSAHSEFLLFSLMGGDHVVVPLCLLGAVGLDLCVWHFFSGRLATNIPRRTQQLFLFLILLRIHLSTLGEFVSWRPPRTPALPFPVLILPTHGLPLHSPAA